MWFCDQNGLKFNRSNIFCWVVYHEKVNFEEFIIEKRKKKGKKDDGNLILYLPSQGFLFPIREAMDA